MSTRDAALWRGARTLGDLGELTAQWLEGAIGSEPGTMPGYGPDEETGPLVPVLAAANRAGFVTQFSQPGEDDSGWTQRAAVCGFASAATFRALAAAARFAVAGSRRTYGGAGRSVGRELDEDELIGNWTRGKPLGGPGSGPYPSAMTTLAPGDRFRLWPAVWPLVRILVLSALPVPDLPSRRKIRRAARDLARGCDPWPGMEASGADVARLALHRLLYLQQATHRAVRSHQDEAATMLARVAIETYITGLYCLYEPGAVAKLQNVQLKMLQPMLEFLREDGGILSGVPRDVLDECIRRLDVGTPADGPKVWDMAERVDAATGSTIAISLYNRFYRPTSNFAIHAGAASLLRHVRGDGRTASRPSRIWGRRAPARIADACLGGLTAFLADREGGSWQHTARHAARYADRHHERAIPPIAAISLGGIGRGLRLSQARQAAQAIARVREFGQYVQSGQDVGDPAARTARIRAELQDLLTIPGLDVPPGSLDPFIDYLAEKIVAETQPPTAPEMRGQTK